MYDGQGQYYSIKGHHGHHHKGKYLSMTSHERFGDIPKYTVFLSDRRLNLPTVTSLWHFKWHNGLVRIVGVNTKANDNDGLALYKQGNELKVSIANGYNQHYWDVTYKGPKAHGANRFQIAFACNFAGASDGTCEGEGNELVAYGPNSNALRFENSRYDSPHASWWEYELDGQ